MLSDAAVPMAKCGVPSGPRIVLAAVVLHTPPGDNRAHDAAGAMTRSACCGFIGCVAGQISRPISPGIVLASVGVHVTSEVVAAPYVAAATGLDTEPAGQRLAAVQLLDAGQAAIEQFPLQAGDESPARLPNVPAGQSEQKAAPATANVPGAQKIQMPPLLGSGHEPAAQITGDGSADGGASVADDEGDNERLAGVADAVGESERVIDGEGVMVDVGDNVGVIDAVPVCEAEGDGIGSATDRLKMRLTSSVDSARAYTRSSSRLPTKAQPEE